jgi:hypothetical protein
MIFASPVNDPSFDEEQIKVHQRLAAVQFQTIHSESLLPVRISSRTLIAPSSETPSNGRVTEMIASKRQTTSDSHKVVQWRPWTGCT